MFSNNKQGVFKLVSLVFRELVKKNIYTNIENE